MYKTLASLCSDFSECRFARIECHFGPESVPISAEYALKSADRSWAVSKARTMIGYVLVRRQGYSLGAVARYFARDAATVATLIGRLAERIAENEPLRREIDKLSKKVEK